MSVVGGIYRFALGTVLFVALGISIRFAWVLVLEPMWFAFGAEPARAGWGEPAATALTTTASGAMVLLAVLIVWIVYSPIQDDVRQQ